jgi:hypothetical protein
MGDSLVIPVRVRGSDDFVDMRIDKDDWPVYWGKAWTAVKPSRNGIESNTYYVSRKTTKGNTLLLHREIMEAGKLDEVDHKNGDGLDNRRENLRLCTRGQNACNARKTNRARSSRFKGVSWDRANRKWAAQICKDYQNRLIGRFDDEEEAARAYDEQAKILHGEFARLNFPNE